MKKALEILKQNGTPEDRVSFQELKDDVGFDEYYREEERYSDGSKSGDGADCFNDDVGFSGT